MARPIRVEYANAAYHVAARGNERRDIVRDDDDRRGWLEVVGEACDRFGLVVHAYCLMPNHYHLLAQTPRANLSEAIGWMQVTYSVRFNRRHHRSGHLFQGRYKAHLVEADEYAQVLIPYLHLNPVRPRNRKMPVPAERRAALDRYRWSSHRAYAGLSGPKGVEPWLCMDWLSYFGRTRRAASAGYRRQVTSMFGQPVPSPFDDVRGGLVLGGDDLWNKAQSMIESSAGQEEIRWKRRADRGRVARWLSQQIAAEEDARIRIWLCVQLGGERMTTVGVRYGYSDGSGVLRVVQRLERRAEADRELADRLAAYRAAVLEVKD